LEDNPYDTEIARSERAGEVNVRARGRKNAFEASQRAMARDGASSSSDDDGDGDGDEETTNSEGRARARARERTRRVPRIEIKPVSTSGGNQRDGKMSWREFAFAPPPRARGTAREASERARMGIGEYGSHASRESARAIAGNAPSASAVKKKVKARAAVDPYDFLDSIVGDVAAKGVATVAEPRARAPSPASSVERYPQGAMSPRGGKNVSSRGGAAAGSFATDSSFLEELAQISLPDTDTINPKREFARGLKLFDANKLSEALFAFVAAAVNAVHSGDEVAVRCASYATACKILLDATRFLASDVSECARLTRHLVALPNIDERHRRASLRFASAKNFKSGNAGTAATMITTLIAISPPEMVPSLQAMLKQCQAAGEIDTDVPADEDARKMCSATLKSIPATENGMTCANCGALHSTKAALETGQCVICRSALTSREQRASGESLRW